MAYQKIVAGTDFSALSEVAVLAAGEIATQHGAETLRIVHVVNVTGAVSMMPYAYMANDVQAIQQEAVKGAEQRLAGVKPPVRATKVERVVRVGYPVRELTREVADAKADLLVVASHGYGPLKRAFLGSVSGNLIRVSTTPVLIVGKDRPIQARLSSVLAAVDLSPSSERVLREAFLMAKGSRARVTILSLYEKPIVSYGDDGLLPHHLSPEDANVLALRQKQEVEKLLATVPHPDVPVSIEVMAKAPAPLVILETAQLLKSDLIVIGTSGHGTLHRMILGSTATRVLSEANCPVLVVPNDQAPVT